MTDRELMQMALDAMESFESGTNGLYKGEFAEERKALRERLERPEPEPVAWRWLCNGKPDSDKHFPMPGPNTEVIAKASSCKFPRIFQYLYTAPVDEQPTCQENRLVADNATTKGVFNG
jgi:hypothetical protein